MIRRQSVDFRGIRLGFALLAGVFGAAATAHAQAGAYTFTKIHVPGSVYTEASGINSAGQIGGTFIDASGFPHGFLYNAGTFTTIDFPGAAHNYVFGINDAGQLVGGYAVSDPIVGPWHAFTWQAGTFTEWDYPGRETDGRGVNSSGQVVGIYNAGFGTPDHGFIKTGDQYTSIDFPGAAKTYTFGINDSQVVTGSYVDTAGVLHGFWYHNGAYNVLRFPGATQTYVGGLNNRNVMVGWSQQNGKRFGYTVSTLSSFRGFSAGFAGVTGTMPKAINNNGQIVGFYTSPDCPSGCGFLATPNPAGTPSCTQAVSMTYAGGTLNLRLTVSAATPTTWASYLFVGGIPYRLWSIPIPAIAAPTTYNVPISLAPSGNVILLSLLSTPTGGTICADYGAVNTSTP